MLSIRRSCRYRGGVIGNNAAVPLEIINNGNDETAIGFRNKGVSLGNINFNVNRFQIFSNNLGDIKSKQILVISSGARAIYDYKSRTLKEILVQGDVSHFQPGEVLQFPNENNALCGYLTNGQKTIYFTIPFHKSVKGRTISLEASRINVRCEGKYLMQTANSLNYDIKVNQIVENMVTFTIENPDGSVFSATNNTPVSVSGNFKFTFS